MVFLLWWFRVSSVVKGWIDWVGNYGFAYGHHTPRLRGKRMLWLALVSYEREQFLELGWDEVVGRLLRVGISQFCGIESARVHFVYDWLKVGAGALKEADVALEAVEG